MADEARILWFDAVGSADVKRVGGKNASLGEMIGALKSEGVRVPDGFATTAAAYRDYVNANGIEPKLRAKLETFAAGKASLRGRRRYPPHVLWRASSPGDSQRRLGIRTWSCHAAPAFRQSQLLFAAAPRQRICRRRASPGSRRPS